MKATVDETELDNLVQQLRDGDESVSDRIIIHFMGLARSLSRHAVFRHPNSSDDIRAAALFGLVQAVRWAPKRMYNNHIGPYITVTVRRYIREFLEHNHIIRVPKDAWSSMIEALNLDDLEDYEQLKALKELKQVSMVFQASMPDGTGDFLEDFSSCERSIQIFDLDSITVSEIHKYLKLSYYERAIIDMRIKGHTLHEIGDSLQKSHVSIYNALKKLQERYRTIQRAHPSLPEPPDGI